MPLPAAQTASPDGGKPIRAYVCDEVQVIHYHLGKITPDGHADIQKSDVLTALDRADWADQLHRIMGDTTDTIYRVKLNNAAISALCPLPAK